MGRILRVLLSLLVGGGVAYGLLRLGRTEGLTGYLGCALTGALVGLISGRAPWRAETIWTPVLKMVVGMLIGAGLFALGSHFLPPLKFSVQGVPSELGLRTAAFLSPAIALLYGLFVEVDDGGSGDKEKKEKERQKARKELGV